MHPQRPNLPCIAHEAHAPRCAAAGALAFAHAPAGAAAPPAPSQAVAARQRACPFPPLSPLLGGGTCRTARPRHVRPSSGAPGPLVHPLAGCRRPAPRTERPAASRLRPRRHLQSHPHIHSIVPGGGRSADRTTWRPSHATFCVPVTALSPLSRARFKDARRHAGVLAHSAPQAWTIPWNVHRPANHHGHAAFTSLAPSGFKVALANRCLVGLTDHTVPVTDRQVGSARLRTAPLDGMACLRRCLPHVLPEGCMNVRHFGVRHTSGALPLTTMRLLIGQGHAGEDQPIQRPSPQPLTARCPSCGAPRRVVMRGWPSPKACVDTGGAA